MTVPSSTTADPRFDRSASPTPARRFLRALLTQRTILLAILLVILLVTMLVLDGAGMMAGSFSIAYMSSTLVSAVPMALLGFAQLFVIVSGRGGIDLSVGAIVSLVSMVFGFVYGIWGLDLWIAIIVALVAGGLLGAVNGFFVAYQGFPGLIVTLATFYIYSSIALMVTDRQPISTPPIQDLYSTARSVPLPLVGDWLPRIPAGIFLFLIPTALVMWYVLTRSPYGRRLFAIGTNDVAAEWAGLDVRRTRMLAYVVSGVVSGLVAVVTVGEFASARPDAGTSGNGMVLPAITIAVLGGVAITGGVGRVSGIILATLLVVWLNAGILLLFPGDVGPQIQLLALGAILVAAALLTGYAQRRYRVLT